MPAPHSSLPGLPSHTRALVVHKQGDLRIEERVLASPSEDEAVVEIAYGGICGSDLHYWLHGAAGESILQAPMVLGHEVVGTVLRAAENGAGPAAGTRVAVHPATQGTGDGSRYPAERPNLSPGGTYLGSAARFPHTDGAFARHVILSARMLRPLPDALDMRVASIVEPAAVAWHAAQRAGELSGKRVLVIGAGPIGSLLVASVLALGAAEVVAVDLHEKAMRIAHEVGAARTIHANAREEIAAVDADVSFESSGNHHGLASAVRGTTRGGRVVMVGLQPTGEQPALLSLAITRELELVGSFRFNEEIDEVIDALAKDRLNVAPIITHEYALADAIPAFETAQDPAVSGKVLIKF